MKVNNLTNFYVNKKNSHIKFCLGLSTIREELIIYSEEDRNCEDLDRLSGIVDGNIMNSKHDEFISLAGLQNVNAESTMELIRKSIKNLEQPQQPIKQNVKNKFVFEEENFIDK